MSGVGSMMTAMNRFSCGVRYASGEIADNVISSMMATWHTAPTYPRRQLSPYPAGRYRRLEYYPDGWVAVTGDRAQRYDG
jgi:hypothetical protein